MTDQGNVARRFVHGAIESTGPHVIADIVVSHTVCTADEHPGIYYFLLYPILEQRFCVVIHDKRRLNDGRRNADRDRLVECSLQAVVTDREDDKVGSLRQILKRRVTAVTLYFLMARIHGIDFAAVTAELEILERPLADAIRAGGRADDRNGPRPQQGV